jgi:hypothetical protein
MNETRSTRSFGSTVVAALVLLLAAWLLLHFILGILSFVFSTALLIAAVVGVVWALKVLF